MQRLILHVLGGPRDGAKAVLGPGETLRVGSRAPRADFVVPDEGLAGVHFTLAWDGERCRVERHRHAPELLLGGEKVDAADAPNGAWIRAGATDFTLHREGATPPPHDPDTYWDTAVESELSPIAARWVRQEREPRRLAREALEARRTRALSVLTAPDGPRFAVLDAARSPRIRVLLREAVEPCRSLYDGVDGQALAHVAPYLVELRSTTGEAPEPPGQAEPSALLQRLVAEGWEKRWGIFIDYPGAFTDLRRHLRRFLMVADADAESRRRYYFRFYDPVVVRAFLPTCNDRQRADFFGEIRAIFAEGSDGAEMARFDGEGGNGGPRATLKLTREQRARVGDPAFVQRVLSYLRRFHKRELYQLRDPVLRRRIAHGIERGRTYGLTWEYSLGLFVSHMLRVNPEFDQHPAVQRALRDPGTPPDERLDTLVNAVTRDEWEEVGRWGDPAAYWRKIDERSEP